MNLNKIVSNIPIHDKIHEIVANKNDLEKATKPISDKGADVDKVNSKE
jgi:hypothetical protein